jgi:hypothetical protein
MMKKVYCVKHFWGADDDEPTEYFVQAEKRPTVAQVAAYVDDYEPKRDRITIASLEVYDLETDEYVR